MNTQSATDIARRAGSFLDEAYPGRHKNKRIALRFAISPDMAKLLRAGRGWTAARLGEAARMFGWRFVHFIYAPIIDDTSLPDHAPLPGGHGVAPADRSGGAPFPPTVLSQPADAWDPSAHRADGKSFGPARAAKAPPAGDASYLASPPTCGAASPHATTRPRLVVAAASDTRRQNGGS